MLIWQTWLITASCVLCGCGGLATHNGHAAVQSGFQGMGDAFCVWDRSRLGQVHMEPVQQK